VIVLGAGAAGLACAEALVRAGRRPIVLEARTRIGGRVHTLHERGIALPIELGAEFLHGGAPELLAIARAAGLPLTEMAGESWRRTHDGFGPFRRIGVQLAATFGRMRVPRDASVSAALARSRASRDARAAAASFVEGFDAAPADETSAQWILRSQAGAAAAVRQAMRFPEGYDGVVDWLRRGAAREGVDVVRTCAIAKRVDWQPGHVRVTCASPTGAPLEDVEGQSLVSTLPIGVLRDAPGSPGAVRFDPPLPPRHVRAVNLLAMGDVVRLTLQLRKPLWTFGLGFLQAPAQPLPTWWTAHPFDEARIVGWCGGPKASALRARGERAVLDAGVRSLARALGVPRRHVERELAAWWWYDWSADPFARGAYAYARVGGALAWRALARPIRGTLFFAGEATCDASSAGTVHGAIASGRRAARGVVATGAPRMT
jgi:monoamine oxidase